MDVRILVFRRRSLVLEHTWTSRTVLTIRGCWHSHRATGKVEKNHVGRECGSEQSNALPSSTSKTENNRRGIGNKYDPERLEEC